MNLKAIYGAKYDEKCNAQSNKNVDTHSNKVKIFIHEYALYR